MRCREAGPPRVDNENKNRGETAHENPVSGSPTGSSAWSSWSLLLLVSRFSDLIQSLERKAYDMGVRASSRTPSDKIAVIAIDDTRSPTSAAGPGRAKCTRKMTDLLAGAKAKVIGNTVFLFEPQIDPGYQYITKLLRAAGRRRAEPPSAETRRRWSRC